MNRMWRSALSAVAALALLTGCSQSSAVVPTGPSAQQVVEALNAVVPLGAQSNPESCPVAGCEELIVTDAVSVHRMSDEQAAVHFVRGLGAAVEQVGPFVLSYSGTRQQLTSAATRQAYAERIRTLLAS